MTRKDIHRPSVINPCDYSYVGIEHEEINAFNFGFIQEMRERIRAHMTQTGGTYSRHEHGGNCHICGAHCIYTVLFYHEKSNTYIRTGRDCANKLEMAGNNGEFDAFKLALKQGLEFQTGKKRARATLEAENLLQAWEIYEQAGEFYSNGRGLELLYEEKTTHDIISKLIKYGDLTEKQFNFLKNLLHKINNREKIEAERKAERDRAEDCPKGRLEVSGQVLRTEIRDGQYGEEVKMTIKTDRGFILWGTIPRNILEYEQVGLSQPYQYVVNRQGINIKSPARGDTVKFTATLIPSNTDSKFGFYKRPTNAEILSRALDK